MCGGLNHLIFVPTDSFYDYVKSGNFPKHLLRSVLSNLGAKHNYKKFAKRIKKAIKYLPPELEVEIRVTRSTDMPRYIDKVSQ